MPDTVITDVWRLSEESDSYLRTDCTDPFGNVTEIYSHSHAEMYAGAPRAGETLTESSRRREGRLEWRCRR